MPPASETIRLVYELSTVDKGTRQVLASERAVQRESRQTTQAMSRKDAASKRSARVAEESSRREERAAKRSAAAQRKASDPGLLRRGAGGVAGAGRHAVALVAGVASVAAAEKAVSVTETLAKTTLTLHNSFGLVVKDASRWAAVSMARGADGKQMTMGFKALATAVRNARVATGGQTEALDKLREKNALKIAQAEQDASRMKDQHEAQRKLTRVQVAAAQAEADLAGKTASSAKVFQQLGISQQDLVKHGNDMNWVLRAVSDGLARMPRGTDKAAVSAKLFGRTWTTIAPLIRDGSKSLDEQLRMADKYGATMGVSTVAELQKHIKAEREAKLAVLGLQVAFGTKVAPTLTKIIEKTSAFAAQMHAGTGAGGRFARQAREIGDELRPVADALKTAGRYLAAHPRLVIAAAAAYASFKAARGTLRIVNDIRAIGTAIAAVTRRAAKTKIATIIADNAADSGALARIRAVGKTAGGAFGRAFTIAAAAGVGAAASSALDAVIAQIHRRFGETAGDVANVIAKGPLGAIENAIGRRITPNAGDLTKLIGKRRGGLVGMAAGGLVPVLAAGGELHVDGERAAVVPGDPRSDSTLMWARPGSAFVTGDGQARMAAGASLSEAVARQAPHFAKGGRVSTGSFRATAYGPPWGGIQGGGTTATGVNLRRSPHVYGVAVDPSVIALGSQLYAWPNPFNRSGPFRAFDTGGAIKGNRLDFYDWRGRESQNRWGSRMVRVSGARIHAVGRGPAADASADVTARVPLSLSPSRVRAGLVSDAVEQGIAAGAAGLTRREIARGAAGGRGSRRNPIMEAIAAAMTPSFREVTIPGKTDAGGGGRVGGPLPGGVTVPHAAWNPAKRPIARWIVPYLSWAASASRGGAAGPARRGAGGGRWAGIVTSGFRSLAEQKRIWASGVRPAARPGTSNHEGSSFPRGAVDVTQAAQLSAVLRGKPGAHNLVWAGAKDPVHFSNPHGGSYRRGGVVGGGRLGSALGTAMSFKGGSLDALDAVIGRAVEARLDALRAEVVRRVRRGGDKRTVQRLQSVIDLVDFELGRRIGRYQDVVERRTAQLDRATAAAERGLRLAGVDPSSPVGAAVMGRAQGAETGVRRQNVASLRRALAVARRTGNREVIRDVTDRLREAQDALAESLVKQVENWRDQLRALGEEAVSRAQFGLGLTQTGGSILESWQRTAGVQDTAAAMAQRVQYTVGATIPALQQQMQASQFAAQMAAAAGDLNGWRSAVQDAAAAAADIASAQADAADLIRAAAQKQAQDVVDAATHTRTMSDLGLQRLELEQQLIGTFEGAGGAQGRADFIRSQIIPAIQGEIAALVLQLATAQATGDQALATQIAEAIYGKQNDVLQQQLAAQQATAENTSALKEFGGSLAFGYLGQVQTDLDVIRARAGA